MLNLSNVYHYYSGQIAIPKQNLRSDSQKKDDLKALYHNIVKQNQQSPFYKFTFSNTVQAYTIGIKEAAMSLESDSESLSGTDERFNEMKAVSSNEGVLYANLRDIANEDLPDKLAIKVDQLATGQTNVGAYLPSGENAFTPGNYTLGIAVGSNQYTFNLKITADETNQQIQRNLADAINSNDIGIRASIRNNRIDGTSALVLRSESIGTPQTDDLFFQFDETYIENDITTALGLDHVDTEPSDAHFYINGDEHTSASNRISLNHALDIDLLSTSDKDVTVYLAPDENKISDKLDNFLASYNDLVDIARNGFHQKGASRLYHDITGIASRHSAVLSEAGLTLDENGYLNRSDDADSLQIKRLFDEDMSGFRSDIHRVTQKMILNPLDYIDKVVVTYPNTNINYPNPYIPSKYSGLLFNDYA